MIFNIILGIGRNWKRFVLESQENRFKTSYSEWSSIQSKQEISCSAFHVFLS